MESSAALPHAARELLLKGGGCAVNFECAPELCAPLRAELARSGRSVGFVRADEGFYDRMDRRLTCVCSSGWRAHGAWPTPRWPPWGWRMRGAHRCAV